MKVPNGHQAIMPYLMLNEAGKFFDFVQTVFDAKESSRTLREDKKTIMHSEIQINGSTIMYCEATEDWKQQNTNLFIYVVNADVAFNKAIEAGAKTIMPLTDQDYGRTCGVEDPFGNRWWITSI
jgi:uncharacterized glyoxalase superfamily protein PhnB